MIGSFKEDKMRGKEGRAIGLVYLNSKSEFWKKWGEKEVNEHSELPNKRSDWAGWIGTALLPI